MQNKEKIIEILMNELNYCYCDNCKYSANDNGYCDDCHRKYQNWALSPVTAEEIADRIIKIGEIYPVSKEEIEGAMHKNAK